MSDTYGLVFVSMWAGFGVAMWTFSTDIDPSYSMPITGFSMVVLSMIIEHYWNKKVD